MVVRLAHRGRAPPGSAVGSPPAAWRAKTPVPSPSRGRMPRVPTVAAWTSDPFDVAAATRLTDELGVSPPTAAILTRRGLGDPDRARAFLAASDRSDPFALHGVAAACDTILDHVERGSRVAVFGDYDVDGVCSTAIMVRCLRALGADPLWQLPSRDEGYGLSEPAVRSAGCGGSRAAGHRRLRRDGGGRGGAGARARPRRGRDRPPPAGPRVARTALSSIPPSASPAGPSCAPRASR